MTSNGPYYQPVTAQDNHISQENYELQHALAAQQPSIYPELPSEYQQQQHSADVDFTDHAQLQGLVQAATTAAAHEQIRRQHLTEYPDPSVLPSDHAQHSPVAAQASRMQSDQELESLLRNGGATKRKRDGSPIAVVGGDDQTSGQSSTRSKRQKRSSTGNIVTGDSRQVYNHLDSPHHLEARAAGVHSAAALFRPPTEKSKKYTRPPMSKLFTSLELSPENFLHLQAAAKRFMLDPDHPERQECVGNRDKADHEMVKLRMFNTVKEFLEVEGWGERCFGEHAPPPGEGPNGTPGLQRKYVWPRDSQKIIALCTPLLRRMLTNERQRQYASETRKPGKAPSASDDAQDVGSAQQVPEHSVPDNPFAPTLGQEPAIHIYFVDPQTQQLARERLDFRLGEDMHYNHLMDVIHREGDSAYNLPLPSPFQDFESRQFSVRVHTPAGLVDVHTAEEWMHAVQQIRQTVWMEYVIKVIVQPPGYARDG